jgi:hypothetical protein
VLCAYNTNAYVLFALAGVDPWLAFVQQSAQLVQVQAAAPLCLAADKRRAASVACSSVPGAAAAAKQAMGWASGLGHLQHAGRCAGKCSAKCPSDSLNVRHCALISFMLSLASAEAGFSPVGSIVLYCIMPYVDNELIQGGSYI